MLYDTLYQELCHNVMIHGIDQHKDKTRAVMIDKEGETRVATARALFGAEVRIPSDMIPVVTTKKFNYKLPLYELAWIWQEKSNVVQRLRDMGTTIWDEWELSTRDEWNGTIGPAYGWVLAQKVRKFPMDKLNLLTLNQNAEFPEIVVRDGVKYALLDQVDYMIQSLMAYPGSRQNIVSLWDSNHVDDMALPPCVWSTNWDTHDGKLNLKLNIRSNDLALGHPFNVFQYNVLLRMIAQVTGYEVGEMVVYIDNAHVYTEHTSQLIEQLEQPIQTNAPQLRINPEVKNFYMFDMETDVEVIWNYPDGQPPKAFKFEVAV